ncbi:MAG: transglutaminase-like domain-containing protein [Phycisphaerae bacterium]|nr:transglutaminase-like domain-containing protein [Phycisphaerae bacterium]
MTIQRIIAVVMILGSSLLTAWASGDIAFPAILCMLGLLGVQRRFTWDIRPERHFVTPLLLLLLATLFAIHCRYAHVRADQAAAFAWQTIARYFLASMTLILFLRPQRTGHFGFRISDFGLNKTLEPNPQSALALPLSLGLFHLANTMAAGQVLLLDDRYVAFRLAELLSVTLVILYAALDGHGFRIADGGPGSKSGVTVLRIGAESRIRNLPSSIRNSLGCGIGSWFPLSLLLLVAINLGWIGGSLLYRHVEVINFLPAWLSRGAAVLEGGTAEVAHVGFSTSGKLASVLSIKEDTDSSPVLTITGDGNPTYLRAMAFESYRQSEWIDRSYPETIMPEQNTPFSMVGRTYLFRLQEKGSPTRSEALGVPNEALRYVTVRHEVSTGDVLFTPLGTCSVEAPFGFLNRDDDDIVSSRHMRSRLSYQVGYVTPSVGNPPTEAQRRRMLAVPTHLDPQIRQRANQIFRRCTTTAEKIDAVTKYFQTNYTYSLGLEIPEEQDALDYFLMKASTGYCEYFASGAAVLLRFVEVPTRYVTGFLVTERGSDGRSWIARNMDAHAWVEAWDAERGHWAIVEATIQEGLDDVSLADELTRGAIGERPFLGLLVQSLYEYGLFGVFGRLLDFGFRISGWRFAPWALASVGIATGLVLRIRKRRRPPSAVRPPQLDALHRLLAAMDRRAKALGYRRHPDETLHAFATRLSSSKSDRIHGGGSPLAAARSPSSSAHGQLPTDDGLADWYLQYAGLRYGPTIDPAGVELLQRLSQERPHSP